MKNKKYIIFDFDGTLFDSQIGIKKAIKFTLAIEDIYDVSDEILESFIGPPLHKSFADHFGFEAEKIDVLITNLRKYYSEKGYKETALYNGIEDLILSLKKEGKVLAIATAKPTKYALQILKDFNLLTHFASVHGSASKGELFPKDRVIGSVMKDLDLFDAEDCVMIGDTIYDIKGAQYHNMDCIAVNYGYGKHKDLVDARPNKVVETVNELREFIL
ncbi:MAG: HAD hydrolase-like protein [Chitinophagales bacterium]